MNIKHSSENVEHYTPPKYAEAFRSIMDGICLDVASSKLANQIIKANNFLTQEEDPLNIPWHARSIYCNPPGGKTGIKSNQSIWFEKMLLEWVTGSFEEGIFMAFNNAILRTNPESYMKFPFCIPKQRICYWNTKSDLQKQERKNKNFCFSRHLRKCLMNDQYIYITEDDALFPSPSPSHDNVIIYFPPKHDQSKKLTFKKIMDHFGDTRI